MAEDFERNGEPPIDIAQNIPTNFGPLLKWGAVLAAIVALFVISSISRAIYTDLLWFDALGFKSVYTKILSTKIVMFLVGAAIFAGMISTSLWFGLKQSRGEVTLPLPPEVISVLNKAVIVGVIGVGGVLSIIFGTVFSSRWELFLKFTNAAEFPLRDPVYGKSASFYIFDLPILTFLQGWLLGAFIVVLLATLALHFVNFSLRGVNFSLSSTMRLHLSIIAALIMFTIAWGHWLDRWELVLSDQGAVFGAAFTDLNARQPALLVLTIVASASGVLMLVNAYMRGLRILVGAVALWLVLALLLGAAWPALTQQFSVTPNEFVKEEEFIARNIEFTRQGFALERIEEQFYPAETEITADLVRNNITTVNNIRLWDPRPLSDVYRQIQAIRTYYDFVDADMDRYTIDGQYRQVALSAREVAPEGLSAESQTWVNNKLVYTHGIGVAMSPVTEFTPEGRPVFFAKDIPNDGTLPVGVENSPSGPDLLIDNPRIYYGENTLEHTVVNSATDELDYQTSGDVLIRNRYDGTGGVRMSSIFRKLAYTWQIGDINLLISSQITSESRLQYRRSIEERIATVAPFLILDADPYIVVADGKLTWIQDAYTATDKFPYSDPSGDIETGTFNYMRNSVKITIDAYNGDLTFYIWDTADPIVQTYSKIFPDLFTDGSEMAPALRTHVRYPLDFFAAQAEKYIKYHMQDPQNFYNNVDLWETPNEKFGQSDTLQPVEPYYAIMKLPGEEKEEFVLLFPYTPNQRKNLIGWMAARSDGEHYGKLLAFNFPKDLNVDGPEQVEARIDNDQDISAWFTLRCSAGSVCIRGNLLVIPIANSLLYAEPVYIRAEGVNFPELKRVILGTADKVVMEDSLELALAELTGDRSFAAGSGDSPSSTGPTTPTPGATAPSASDTVGGQIETVTETLDSIKLDIEKLEEALERLKELTGGD
ncbi:MAG: UPF0182 family protein [SAR202 cluster bacterium]|jgi:hypothetical protein|nr:UPF0182 family protein [SAR202 cluster bacterium]